MAPAAAAISTDTYRREARRLRCRHAGNPLALQRSLRALAARASTGHEAAPPPVADVSPSPARQFTDYLHEHATESVLRYSQRLEMFRAARRMGIARFEANLLIAAVVDRNARRVEEDDPVPRRFPAWLGAVGVFCMVQATVGALAWWALFR
jgi:hypothetical protein